jgi:hypothetical protein
VRSRAAARTVLDLQRTAGNAAVGALLRQRSRALARCAGGSCTCAGCHGGAELEEELEGKGLDPEPTLDEEIEGHRGATLTPRARALQRLTISRHSFHKGDCGERNVQWVFALDKPAPEDGYIVQHIQSFSFVKSCPDPAIGPPGPEKEFWEAWFVKKGDTLDWTTVRDKWTDGSTRPAGSSQNGIQMSAGTVKFFAKSTTGDLGDFGKAPAAGTSVWGPGKVPTSGALPSTPKKPPWWDKTPVEGPADRLATSQWDCCDADATKHTNSVTATP